MIGDGLDSMLPLDDLEEDESWRRKGGELTELTEEKEDWRFVYCAPRRKLGRSRCGSRAGWSFAEGGGG